MSHSVTLSKGLSLGLGFPLSGALGSISLCPDSLLGCWEACVGWKGFASLPSISPWIAEGDVASPLFQMRKQVQRCAQSQRKCWDQNLTC